MLKIAVPIVSLMTALIIGAINAKMLPPGALWICAFGFAVLAGTFIWPSARKLLERLRDWRVQRRIKTTYRDQIVALRRALKPLGSQSVVFSVGSVLNRDVSLKLLGGAGVSGYQTTLAALFDWILDLEKLTSQLSDAEMMSRIHAWLQTYIRVCDGVSSGMRSGLRNDSSGLQKDGLVRDWMRINEHLNAMRAEYSRIAHGIKAIDVHAAVPDYLPLVEAIV